VVAADSNRGQLVESSTMLRTSSQRTLAIVRLECHGTRGSTASKHGRWCDRRSKYDQCQEGDSPYLGGYTPLRSVRSHISFMT
jgi:hypothetical protein